MARFSFYKNGQLHRVHIPDRWALYRHLQMQYHSHADGFSHFARWVHDGCIMITAHYAGFLPRWYIVGELDTDDILQDLDAVDEDDLITLFDTDEPVSGGQYDNPSHCNPKTTRRTKKLVLAP